MKKILLILFVLTTQLINFSFTQDEVPQTLVCETIADKKNTTVETLTMQQAVEIAYKNKPNIQALNYQIQANKYEEKAKIAGYYPQVNITERGSFSSGAKGPQNSIQISASQLVYSFAGPRELYRIAKKDTDLSKLSKEQLEDLVRYEVESSFLQSWLLQRKNLLIEKLNITTTQTFKKAEHETQEDLLGKNDQLKEAATYADGMANVFLYTDQLLDAQAELEYYIGKTFNDNEKTVVLEWDFEGKIDLKPVNYYYELAYKNRKEIKQKQTELEKQVEVENYYRKTYLPNLNITGNSGRSAGSASSNVGATISWNVFDGGANFREKQKAHANMLKASMEKEHYKTLAKYEVQDAYYTLSQYLKQLIAKDVELTQAQNQFKLSEQEYQIGQISKVDLDQAVYNWETKQFEWVSLKINCEILYRKLMYSCGYPEEINPR